MKHMPEPVAEFLAGRRIVVAGVSRKPQHFANAIFRKLHDTGYEVMALNPNAEEVEGFQCYPNLAAVPGWIDGVVAAIHPRLGLDLVHQAAERGGVGQIWFHRLMGTGSVSREAVRGCRAQGVRCIVGGCPLMYVEPVDPFHRCFRWLLRWSGRAVG
ncbi:MAG TPA: CoA-binding protein [Gemmatimonadales bacterium]|nr:CoA-binding protein [Gemmatimonadales bacterium]